MSKSKKSKKSQQKSHQTHQLNREKELQRTGERVPGESVAVKPSPNGIDVVIPVHNQLELLTQTVKSIKDTASVGDFIFVDDGSTEPGIGKFCSQNGRYIQLKQGQGFAKACNFGANRVHSSRFLLMNSDLIATPRWLDSLVEMMDSNKDYAVVGPLLLFFNDSVDPNRPAGKVQSCGFVINIRGVPYHRLVGWSPDHPKVQYARDDLQGVTGACWLVDTGVWKRLGGFEPTYESYFEDVDFCVRAKNAGYKVAYTPKSVLYHQVGGSYDGKDNHLDVKAAYFAQRNRGKFHYDEHLML